MSADDYAAVKAERTAEYNYRLAIHESCHAYLVKACGSVVEFLTILPNGVYAGRCVRRGAASQSLGLVDENQAIVAEPSPDWPELTTEQLVATCNKIGSPEIGMPRVEFANEITCSMVMVIELVGARVGERIFWPEREPLPAEHDYIEARALAGVVCSAGAVDAFIRFAEIEAEQLIRAHMGAVAALADALVERGTLNGNEVDEIIARAVDVEKLTRLEHPRRRDMQDRADRAKQFKKTIADNEQQC